MYNYKTVKTFNKNRYPAASRTLNSAVTKLLITDVFLHDS